MMERIADLFLETRAKCVENTNVDIRPCKAGCKQSETYVKIKETVPTARRHVLWLRKGKFSSACQPCRSNLLCFFLEFNRMGSRGFWNPKGQWYRRGHSRVVFSGVEKAITADGS